VPSIAVSYAGADLDLLDTHKPGLTGLLRRITQVKDFPKETSSISICPASRATR